MRICIIVLLSLLQFQIRANETFRDEIKAISILMDYQKNFLSNYDYQKYKYSSPIKINKCLYDIDVYQKTRILDYEIDICERSVNQL